MISSCPLDRKFKTSIGNKSWWKTSGRLSHSLQQLTSCLVGEILISRMGNTWEGGWRGGKDKVKFEQTYKGQVQCLTTSGLTTSQSMSLRALSKCLLNRHRASLFQCLTTLLVKFFLTSILKYFQDLTLLSRVDVFIIRSVVTQAFLWKASEVWELKKPENSCTRTEKTCQNHKTHSIGRLGKDTSAGLLAHGKYLVILETG